MAIQVINKKRNPHLALTHMELQNGAANGRNLSLLLKADAEIDEDTASLIEEITGVKVEVNKASYNSIRESLEEGIRKFKSTEYGWTWVVDFDEDTVVFSNDSGMFYTTYSINGLKVEVGSEATEVSRVVNYVEGEDKIVLSEALETVDGGVRSLIVKSFDSISKNEKLVDVFKSKKGNLMQEEITKAVGVATQVLKAELEETKTLLEKANEKIEAFEKAEEDHKKAYRKSELEKALTDSDKIEALLKSTSSLDDESFKTIVSTLVEKAKVVEDSDLFNKVSEASPITKADEAPLHVQILQKQFGIKE